MTNRKVVVAGCLMLLWSGAAAQQSEPHRRTPTAPDPHTRPATPAEGPPAPPTEQPAPAQPPVVQPPVIQPAPVVSPFQPLAVVPSTTAIMVPVLRDVPPPPPPLGSELRGKLKEDELHFNEKSAAARRDFDARQAQEKKEFDLTPKEGAGFWESRRLRRLFREDQAKRRRDFNDEQEKKRETYGWRYP